MKVYSISPIRFTASLVLYTVLFLIFSGCKKSEKEKQFILYNYTGKMNVDIYKSQQDFYDGTVYIHQRLDSNSNLSIPISKLVLGNTYYMDCYSDNYYRTNLYWRHYKGQEYRCYFTPTANQMTTSISVTNSIWRPLIWNKNQLQSRWKAIDAVNDSLSSVWSTLPDSARFKEVIINRDQIIIFRFILNNDTISRTEGDLANAFDYQGDSLSNMEGTDGGLYNFFNLIHPVPLKDSLMLYFWGVSQRYVLVRE